MKGIGIALMITAALLGFYALVMDPSVTAGYGQRVMNFGLMHDKQLMMMISGFLGLIGAVLYAGGAVVFEMGTAALSQDAQPDRAQLFAEWRDQRECPHCLSKINRKARVCAHCSREVPSATPRRALKVTDVANASSAGYAGLSSGDVIIQINGVNVCDGDALDNAVAQTSSGYLVMKVVRRQSILTLKVLISASRKLGINVEPFAFAD